MEDATGARSENVEIDIESSCRGGSCTRPSGSRPGMTEQAESTLTVTVSKNWLLSPDRKYPIKIDPSLQLTILTVHSHPQQGDNWTVDFETEGQADLKIIPDDQATVEDDEFESLTCGAEGKTSEVKSSETSEVGEFGGREINVQILENDVIYVKDFQCPGTATVTHYTKKAGKHTLRFEFGGQVTYAYNDPGSTTYNFSDVDTTTDDHYAWKDYGASIFSGPDDTPGQGEATDTQYGEVESDNGTRWETAGASSDGNYDAQMYKFFISEDESSVTQLDFKWNGYGETTSSYNTTFYAYDYDGSSWTQLSQVDFTATTDQDLTHTESTDPGKFIDTDGEVTLMAKTEKYVGPCEGSTSITYGGQTYNLVGIGSQCWFGENLNVTDGNEAQSCTFTRYCYSDNSSNCDTYGGLYKWDDAMCGSETNGAQGICPDGWHIPTDSELTTLEDNVCGDSGDEGSALASNADLWDGAGQDCTLDSDNDFDCSGFELLPGGARGTIGSGSYIHLGYNAYLWSSTGGLSSAYSRRVYYDTTDVTRTNYDKDYGFSVRCLKDSNSLYTDYVELDITYTKANGETCTADSDCTSGNCVDGYCCDTTCGGTCEACDLSGSEGTCTYIADGNDPDGECDSTCVSGCEDRTGDCDGAGACKTTYCSAGTACSSGTCGAGNYCNETWAYCSAPGDNNYDDGGSAYSCQAQCDGSNNCDYAANCSSTDMSCYCTLDENGEDSQIVVNWTDDSGSESGYEIDRDVNSTGFSDSTTEAADTTSYTDTDISSSNTYQYRIRTNFSDGSFGSWCTTDTLNLGVGNFNFVWVVAWGLKFVI